MKSQITWLLFYRMGGKSKILLNRTDGLVMPYGIHVNKDGNLLLVCNANESLAFLYKLSNNL